MLLLQTQLDVNAKILKGLELCGYFVAAIYTKHWFEAPVGAEAAANGLQLYKMLLDPERIPVFKDISDTAVSASKRHLGISAKSKSHSLCVLASCRSILNKKSIF